ncbi:MAG: hypothetical protein ACT4PK_11560 [Gammaproteobacteria bacterium]
MTEKKRKKGDRTIFRTMEAKNSSVPFVLVLLALPLAAHAVEFKPKLEAEGRYFYDAEDADGDAPLLGSIAGTLEFYAAFDDGGQRIVGEFFGRWDENDDQRTHGDVRELYWQLSGEGFELRAGARRVFWGVAESRHLVDIVNQSDFVENISNELKLGQPMVSLARVFDAGTIEGFLMPLHRERTFPGVDGWPQLPLPVSEDAMYTSNDGDHNLDYALRYSGSFGPVDVGIAWFDGTGREPRLVIGGVFPNLVLVPTYDAWRQASLDAQLVTGSMAWKLEAVNRDTAGERTWGSVAGFEYTFGDVGGSGMDIGVLGEYLSDQKDDGLSILVDDEVFAGVRLALNDVAGTTLLAGVLASSDDGKTRRYGLEASGRLNDNWKLSGEARIFSAFPTTDPILAAFADQSFITLTLERFF